MPGKTQKLAPKDNQAFTPTPGADAATDEPVGTIGVQNWKSSDPHPTERAIATEEELGGKTLAQHLNK